MMAPVDGVGGAQLKTTPTSEIPVAERLVTGPGRPDRSVCVLRRVVGGAG